MEVHMFFPRVTQITGTFRLGRKLAHTLSAVGIELDRRFLGTLYLAVSLEVVLTPCCSVLFYKDKR